MPRQIEPSVYITRLLHSGPDLFPGFTHCLGNSGTEVVSLSLSLLILHQGLDWWAHHLIFPLHTPSPNPRYSLGPISSLWLSLVSPQHSAFDQEAHCTSQHKLPSYHLTSYLAGISNLQTQSNLHILSYSQTWYICLILSYAYMLSDPQV